MQVQYGSVVGLDAYMCFLLQVWRKLPRPRAKRAGRQAALRDLEEGRAPLLLSHRAGMGARGKFELPGNLHPVATGELQVGKYTSTQPALLQPLQKRTHYAHDARAPTGIVVLC
jgi:hypothetical protein